MRLHLSLLFFVLFVETGSLALLTSVRPKNSKRFTVTARMTHVLANADHNSGTPIASSSLVFAEDQELQTKRRAAFDRLQHIVESLAELDGNKVSLMWHGDGDENQNGIAHIKSLLFHVHTGQTDKQVVVVIVPSNSKVNIRKLEAHLSKPNNHDERIHNQRVSCSLVPADQVEAYCGFPPRSVPPLGHIPHTLRILVEESLYQENGTILLLGGGGHPKVGCRIAAGTLLKVQGTELADLAPIASPSELECRDDGRAEIAPSTFSSSATKPYFPMAPPNVEQVQEILSHPDNPNPLTPLSFTLVGRINGIRRMARRLVFCDIAPPDYIGTSTKVDAYDLTWKSALDGQDMAAQLIAGKTFFQNGGDEEALKNLRVGQLILAQGKTKVGNRESLQHWVEKRSLDIVVWDIRLLEEAPPRRQGANVAGVDRAREKRRRWPTSNAPPPDPEHCIKLADVLSQINGDSPIRIVDSKESVLEFQRRLEALSRDSFGDNTPIVTGIDCEWKPNFMLEPSDLQPVLLLQISLPKLHKVYLFDLQSLLRPGLESSEATSDVEQVVSDALAMLFGSSRFLKVGFQVTTDLQRLVGSYPHIQAFRSFQAVSEVGTVAKTAMQIGHVAKSRQWTCSLSKLTEYLLHRPINKEQQISDWSNRPLTDAQQEYAALDAAVTPVLLEKSMTLAGARWTGEAQMGRHTDDAAFARAVSSVRFLFLGNETSPASLRRLKAKKIVSDQWMVAQSWVTGNEEPALPSTTDNDGQYVDVDGVFRVPAKRLKVRNNGICPVENLVGRRLGKSKDGCLEALLAGNTNFPSGAMIDYNQRSGYVEFEDCIALFVNSPLQPGDPAPPRGYPNVWLENGKFLTWFLRENEWQGGVSQLAKKLLGNESNTEQHAPCVLFVREGKGGFVCCGQCRVGSSRAATGRETTISSGGLVELQLELVDWSKLKNAAYFGDIDFSNGEKDIEGKAVQEHCELALGHGNSDSNPD